MSHSWDDSKRRVGGASALGLVTLGVGAVLLGAVLGPSALLPAASSTEPPPLYLHSSNVLNSVAPTASSPQLRDSPAINRTAFKPIGAWAAAPAATALSLGAVSDLHVWLGLKNSDDQGTNFDLRAELSRNGLVIATAETKNIVGVTRNPDKAKEVTAAFGPVTDPHFAPGDVLVLALFAKVTDTGGHTSAVGLRLYYDAASRPARFGAAVGPANLPPVADAGLDAHALTLVPATVDGTGSFDPDGDLITFHWALISAPEGSAAALAGPTQPKPAFTPDLPGSYVFDLVVNDGQVNSAAARVTLRADTNNVPPNARAGRDQTALVGAAVAVDGSQSVDPEGALLTFTWSFDAVPAGSGAELTGPLTATPHFTPDRAGTYVLRLHVSAGTLGDEDTVQVVASLPNVGPHADAGPDRTVNGGAAISLTGTGSGDPDSGPAPLSFLWHLVARPAGSALTSASLVNATTATPSFMPDVLGAYLFRLKVSDGGKTDADNVLIGVVGNRSPVAGDDAATTGRDTAVNIAVLTNDSDPDGDPLTVTGFTQGAHGSVSVTNNVARYTPGAGFGGTDTFTYTISDGHGGSASATVTVRVNTAPVVTAGVVISTITLPAQAALTGTVSDDGLPSPPTLVTTLWTKQSGPGDPGSVTFGAATQLNTSASFAQAGAYGLRLSAFDGQLTTTADVNITVNPAGGGDGLPPDPSTVAPPLDPSVASTLGKGTEFLYTGANPIQTGVPLGTIDPVRAAVLRGKVMTRDGAPLSGVQITVLNHSEFGQTLSRADGAFDMAANGGGLLTVDYQKTGFLPAQRQVNVPWQDFAVLPDVIMVPLDPQVTPINLNAGAMQVARGSMMTDSDGTRRATLLIPQGTTANLVMPNGSTQAITALNVRATEYTVGPNGPKAMPAALPPTSGYTYAVELSADEAIAAGAKNVSFSQPLIHYVENFLNFPVGTIVPVGFYDRDKAAWVPSDNGRVIGITSVTGGLANVDTVGASSLPPLALSDAERQQLALLYSPGQSLWRVPVTHFTPWDYNWPFGPPNDATRAQVSSPTSDDQLDKPTCSGGSIIECENQTLGETVGLVGTPFTLNYRSARVPGRTAARVLRIELSGASVPASLKRIELGVQVAGRTFQQSFASGPNQQTLFTWDGLDAYGRTLQGGQPATVNIGYVYDGVYKQPNTATPSAFGYNGNGLPITGDRARQEITISQSSMTMIGPLDARAFGLGGWSLGSHHLYDSVTRVLHLGNGGRRGADSLARVITTVAGNGDDSFSGDGGPATQASLNGPRGVAVGPDGSLYFADIDNARIRRVAPNGIITTVAGTGNATFSGDGGPAAQASLVGPFGVAVGPDGSLYIADADNNRIRRVAPNGIITTVAGTGNATFSGDGGLATQAAVQSPRGVAVGPDGSLYVADRGNQRIRQVAPDGIITTVAGNGVFGFSGDGGPATQASFRIPFGVATGPDGSLYIADRSNQRIRRVAPDGIITTVAGNGSASFSGDGGPATQAALDDPNGVAVGPDGSLDIGDGNNHRIRRVAAPLQGFSATDFAIPSEDGSLLYQFNSTGRHLRTLDALTGAVLYEFTYDSAGRLANVIEKTGGTDNVTTIQHDGSGNPTKIIGPYGQETLLSVDANGFLASISNPAGEVIQLVSTSTGLLTTFTNPRGKTSTYSYNADGRLISGTDPAGGSQTFVRTDAIKQYQVDRTTGLSRTTTYKVEDLPGHVRTRTITSPDGTQNISQESIDAGMTTFTEAIGTITNTQLGPDPRFGVQAPFTTSLSINLPGGNSLTASRNQSAVLSNPNDPLSFVNVTDTSTVDGRTTTSTYTAATKTRTTTTPAGRTSSLTIDSRGRPVQAQVSGLDPATFTYDARGRLASITRGSGPSSRTLLFAYNPQGFLATITDPIGRTAQLTYDGAGRIKTKTFPDGRVVNFDYDGAGNMTGLTPPGRPAHTFTYSDRNELTGVTPPTVPDTGPSSFSYNLDKQMTTIIRPDDRTIIIGYDTGGRAATRALATSGVTTATEIQSYDTAGRVSSRTAASGVTSSYTYDGRLPTDESWSGPITGSVTQSYNTSFRLASQLVNGADTVTFSYDNDNLLIGAGDLAITRNPQHGLPTGSILGVVTTTTGYNGFGESNSYAASAGGSSIYDLGFTRDGLGRISQKVETIGGATDTYTYTYDLAGQLTAVSQNGTAVESYTYDANRNRTSATVAGSNITATYDAQDRLTQYGSVTHTYNGAGDLLTKTIGAQTSSYQYDQLGNLIGVTLPGGTTIAYIVDGSSRRVGKKINGTLVKGFLYGDRKRPVAELDGADVIVNRFIYAGRNVPGSMIKGGVTFRIITDQVGSVRLVVNTATGAIAQRMDFDTFGNVLQDTNPGFQPFGFAGGLYDPDTRLVRFGRRDYEPSTGRWTAKDPVGFAGGSTNLYSYVRNRPIDLRDPNGTDGDQSQEGVYEGVVTFEEGIHKGIGIVYTDGRVVRFDKRCGDPGAFGGFGLGCIFSGSADISRQEYPSLRDAYVEGEVVYGPMDEQSTQNVDVWLEGQYENQSTGTYDIFANSCRDLVNDGLNAGQSGGNL
jgi:RHS repeat-associated protein